jgi:hypothetical protein
MNMARSVGTDGWEEILALQVVRNLVQLLPISGEKDTAGSRSVAHADHITLHISRAVRAGSEWLVVPTVAR